MAQPTDIVSKILKGENMKKNPFEKNIEKICSVCGKILLVDSSGNGECPYCGWYNSITNGDNEDYVMFPNVVSENKARELVSEGKPLKPSLEDFLDMLNFYGETEFEYKGDSFSLFWPSEDANIEIGSKKTLNYFKDKEDFIANAKIGDVYVRDIWDKVENPKYM